MQSSEWTQPLESSTSPPDAAPREPGAVVARGHRCCSKRPAEHRARAGGGQARASPRCLPRAAAPPRPAPRRSLPLAAHGLLARVLAALVLLGEQVPERPVVLRKMSRGEGRRFSGTGGWGRRCRRPRPGTRCTAPGTHIDGSQGFRVWGKRGWENELGGSCKIASCGGGATGDWRSGAPQSAAGPHLRTPANPCTPADPRMPARITASALACARIFSLEMTPSSSAHSSHSAHHSRRSAVLKRRQGCAAGV